MVAVDESGADKGRRQETNIQWPKPKHAPNVERTDVNGCCALLLSHEERGNYVGAQQEEKWQCGAERSGKDIQEGSQDWAGVNSCKQANPKAVRMAEKNSQEPNEPERVQLGPVEGLFRVCGDCVH